jgi:hypothetical protein
MLQFHTHIDEAEWDRACGAACRGSMLYYFPVFSRHDFRTGEKGLPRAREQV